MLGKAKKIFGWSKTKSKTKNEERRREREHDLETVDSAAESDSFQSESRQDDGFEEDDYSDEYAEEDARPNRFRRDTRLIFDGILVPTEPEKFTMLKMFAELRSDGSFCDVAFLCQGVLFRAHRVIVSSWSRWLRALLCESSGEEVVSLDVFSSSSFEKVLNYMYGSQLVLAIEVTNLGALIFFIRRRESIAFFIGI